VQELGSLLDPKPEFPSHEDECVVMTSLHQNQIDHHHSPPPPPPRRLFLPQLQWIELVQSPHSMIYRFPKRTILFCTCVDNVSE
jgi:hypothetical protein